jgi:hypothetical protein
MNPTNPIRWDADDLKTIQLGRLLYQDSDRIFKMKKRGKLPFKILLFLLSIGGFIIVARMIQIGTIFSLDGIFCASLALCWSIVLSLLLWKVVLPVKFQKFQVYEDGIIFSFGLHPMLLFNEIKQIEMAKSKRGYHFLLITKNDDKRISIGTYDDDESWAEDVDNVEAISDLMINQWKIKSGFN